MERLFLSLVLCAVREALNMCEQEGVTADVLSDLTITTCGEFNPTGPAIHLPADTSTVVYGVLEAQSSGGFGPPPEEGSVLARLRDRDNAMHELSGSVIQAFLDIFKATDAMVNDDMAQLLVKVTFGDETRASVDAVQPVLLVPNSTVAKSFRDMTFTGQIYNDEPTFTLHAGVHEFDSLTLQFSNTLVGDAVVGTRVSSLGEYNE